MGSKWSLSYDGGWEVSGHLATTEVGSKWSLSYDGGWEVSGHSCVDALLTAVTNRDPLQQNQECVAKYNLELLVASDKKLKGLSNGARIDDFAEL